MGTELGHPFVPLGHHAKPELGLVEATYSQCPRNFSCFPDRPRAWLLPHLRFPMAAGTKSGIPPAFMGRNARPDWRSLSTVLSQRRLYIRKLRGKSPRR